MFEIRESDWKVLRRVKEAALDRFCQGALARIQEASAEKVGTAHERYLNMFRLIENEDGEMAEIFDDLRRSNAVTHLLSMRAAGLVTDEEYADFSQELRDIVDGMQAR